MPPRAEAPRLFYQDRMSVIQMTRPITITPAKPPMMQAPTRSQGTVFISCWPLPQAWRVAAQGLEQCNYLGCVL